MGIYFAGASGVIGSRLVPLLLGAGHTVGAMTRTAENANRLASVGAEPIVCDVFDRQALTNAVRSFSPDILLHELTDLPDETVLAADGVVLRYGLFYGPGTYFEGDLPPAPRVHIDTAAARTLKALDAPSGVLTVVDV
jgi:NAD(P)-dependent dehydrogenase (short-subunit alcohol dehydrogenase family)